jgi:PAS domain S-box-containing protein
MKKEITKILLIEDNPGDARLVREILTEAGAALFKMVLANTLADGLNHLKRNPVDVILLDLTLPDSTGFDTFEKVHTFVPQVPIILLTGLDDEVQATNAVRTGAQDYLVKGQASSGLLVRSIRYAIERKQAEELLRENEARYRSIFEGVEDAIFVETPSGQILDVNQRACEMFGYTRAQFLTKTVADMVPSKKNIIPFDPNGSSTIPIHPVETINVRANGEPFPIELSIRLQKLKGEIVLFVVGRDITERKRIEEELRESEDKFKYIFDNSVVGKSLTQITGEFQANKAFCETLGYSPEELQSKKWQEITHPDDIELTQNEMATLISGEKESARFNKRYLRKDGASVWMDVSSSLRRDEQGKPLYFMTTLVDITERVRAETELRESEKKYHLVFENSGTANTIFDTECRVVLQNSLSQNLTAPLDAFGKTALEVFGPEQGPGVTERMRRVLTTGIPDVFETKFAMPVGTKWIHSSYQPLLNEQQMMIGIQVISQDITSQKQAEEELRKSEAMLKRSQAIAHIGSWELEIAANRLTWSDEVYRMFGVQPREFGATNEAFLDMVHPDDRAAVEAAYTSSLRDGRETYEIDHRIVRRDSGEVRVVHEKCEHLKDASGRIYLSVGMVQDITERKAAEQKIDILNRHLRAISEANQIIVRARDEVSLLDGVCKTIVEVGGYRLAWVGLAEQDRAKSVRQASYFGIEEGYLDTANIVWSDTKLGRGPTGTAIRTGKTIVSQDLLKEPDFKPWRSQAIQRGYAASIAIPLTFDGRCQGALNIYSGELQAFDENEINLLEELAQDLAYGISVLRTRIAREQAEALLRESEERFRVIFEHANDAIHIDNANGEIVAANTRVCEMMGYSLEELLRMHVSDLQAPEARRPGNVIKDELTQHGASIFEGLNLHRSGRRIPIEISIGRIHRSTGDLYVSIVRDITERKQAEEALHNSEERFRKVFDDGPTGMAMTDQQYHIVQANPTFCRLLGYTEHELKELTFKDFTHPEDMQDSIKNVQALEKGELSVFKTEKRYITKDKAVIWGSLTLSTVLNKDGKLQFFLVIIEDITERKRAEIAVRQQMDELQRWYDLTLDRETRSLELKHEVNELLRRLNEPVRYSDTEK